VEDVPEIHADIKEIFKEKIRSLKKSKLKQLILPIIGNAGSGKTHILTNLFNTTVNHNGIFIPIDISLLTDFYPLANIRICESITKEIPPRQPQLSRILQNISCYNFSHVPDNFYETLCSFKKDEFLRINRNVINKLSDKHPTEMKLFSDISRALFFLSSKEFSIFKIANDFLQSIEIDDYEKSEFQFSNNILDPKVIFEGLLWHFSLNNTFPVFAFDQFDALIQDIQRPIDIPSNYVDLQKKDNPNDVIIISFLRALKGISLLSPKTITVLTMFADSWEKLNNKPYYRSLTQPIFDNACYLDIINDTKQSKKLLSNILNQAYQKQGFTPPYDTWPFPPSFFESNLGLFPRDILKKANEFIMDCNRRKTVLEWSDEEPPEEYNGLLEKIEVEFQEFLKVVNLDLFKGKNAEISFWRDALIAFAQSFSLAHDGEHKGVNIDTQYNEKVNPKNMTADVKIVSSKKGVTKETFSIWAILQSNPKAFQSRLKSALLDSGIQSKIHNRKLAVVHFDKPPNGKVTQDLWSNFLKNGGIDVVPNDAELAQLYALKTICEKFPVEDWFLWAKVKKPTNQIKFLFSNLTNLFNL
jgi:hypothetical protein